MLAYVKRKSKLFLTFFPELCVSSLFIHAERMLSKRHSPLIFPTYLFSLGLCMLKCFFPWPLRTLCSKCHAMPWNIRGTIKCSLLCLYPLLYSMKFHSLPFTLHLQMQQHEMLPGLFALVSSHHFICNSTMIKSTHLKINARQNLQITFRNYLFFPPKKYQKLFIRWESTTNDLILDSFYLKGTAGC